MPEANMSAPEALAKTLEMDQLYGALERRTSGLTWIIWGMAVTGIFVTYSFLGVLLVSAGAPVGWLFPIAWAPWVAMGYIATGLMWRSVALAVPKSPLVEFKSAALAGPLFVAIIGGMTVLAPAAGLTLVEPAVILLGVGAALGAVGMLGLVARSASDRLLWIAAGAALAIVAFVGSLVWGASREAAYAGFSFAAPAAAAVVFFLNGLLLNLRS